MSRSVDSESVNPLLRSGVLRALFALNGRYPIQRRDRMTMASFFGSWFATELTLPILASGAMAVVRGIRRGDHREAAGAAGLALHAVAAGIQVSFIAEALRTDDQYRAVLSPYLTADEIDARPSTARIGALLPVVRGHNRSRRRRNVPFTSYEYKGRTSTQKLDVYTSRDDSGSTERKPVLLYIHGGGWVVGDKREQGIPLCKHLAENGWIAVNANYRLSPRAKYPDHIVDVKRAIAWIREHADELGADPDFIAIAGGSAGGHLTALAACTANEPEFQPGFEEADTSLQAAVPIYGVFDMNDSDDVMVPGFRSFIAKWVIGDSEGGERVRRYSPVERVHPDVPPTMVVHGNRDVLVPIGQARPFVRRLRDTSDHATLFVELIGAQHAFEIFPSLRAVRSVEYVERFLDGCRRGVIK